MNYPYVPDANGVLRAIVKRNPAATLHEIQKSHPTLRSVSLDHLSLLFGQLSESRGPCPAE